MAHNKDLDLSSILPPETALDIFMRDVRSFVAENKGQGDVISAQVLLAVLMKDAGVKDFIATRIGVSPIDVEQMTTFAEKSAIGQLQIYRNSRVQQTRITEDDGSGIPDVRTIKTEYTSSSSPDVNLDWALKDNYPKFYLKGKNTLRNPTEIFIGLMLDTHISPPGRGLIDSFTDALEKINLETLHDSIIEEEYEVSPKDPRILSSRFDIGKNLNYKLSKVLASLRAQKGEESGFVLRPEIREFAKVAENVPALDKMDKAPSIAQKLEAITEAMRDPTIVNIVLADPQAREALLEGLARMLDRAAPPVPAARVQTKPSTPDEPPQP